MTAGSLQATDVLVAGAGPAGEACALTLLRYSRRSVVIADRGAPGEWRVGETIGPAVAPLLAWLGVEHLLTEEAHLASAGTAAAWGSPEPVARDFLYSGRGEAWHLDRGRFDSGLAEAVRAGGGALMTHTRVESLTRTDERGWRANLIARDGRRTDLSARFVVDATGRAASIGRSAGAQKRCEDHLVGISGIFDPGPFGSRDSVTLIEAVEHGWWYLALLPQRRLVVTLMSDLDLVRGGGWYREAAWRSLLDETRHVRARLEGAVLLQSPVLRPATSQWLDGSSGPGWIAAGEAAAAFDPLSSMGIGYAITSGIHAARALDAALNGYPDHLANYAGDTRRHFEEFALSRRRYYAMERRWPDAPFWSRRHEGEAGEV